MRLHHLSVGNIAINMKSNLQSTSHFTEEQSALLDEQPVQTIESLGIEQELTFNRAVVFERHDLIQQMAQDMKDVHGWWSLFFVTV